MRDAFKEKRFPYVYFCVTPVADLFRLSDQLMQMNEAYFSFFTFGLFLFD